VRWIVDSGTRGTASIQDAFKEERVAGEVIDHEWVEVDWVPDAKDSRKFHVKELALSEGMMGANVVFVPWPKQ